MRDRSFRSVPGRLAGVTSAGLALWLGLHVGSPAGAQVLARDGALPAAPVQFAQAQGQSPFAITPLERAGGGAGNAIVTRVVLTNGQTGQRFAVDQHGVDAWGVRVHVWETMDPDIAGSSKDPVVGGKRIQINNQVWTVATVARPTATINILSIRRADGMTISLDSEAGLDELRAVAAGLA